MSRCPNSLFGAHKFKPRYDRVFPDRPLKVSGYWTAEDFMENIYRGDVCVRCGEVVNGQLDRFNQIRANQAGS